MEEVLTNDDLLTKIFLHLPIKSLLCFKSVSKHWRYIITDPRFATLFNSSHISGLLCHRSSCHGLLIWNEYTKNYNPCLDFIPLDNEKNSNNISHQLGSITRIPNLSQIIILNSCNGLFLCLGYNEAENIGGYHVFNPSTKQFVTLPDSNFKCSLDGLVLAYDPSKSPYFKVVSICSAIGIESDFYQIEIYSSETNTWRASGKKFRINAIRMYLSRGVYWNGAINWLNAVAKPIYFNLDEERVGFMPCLPVQIYNIWHEFYYFGESSGHLHLVDIVGPTIKYNVYEMKRDYSEWFIKYRVDLSTMVMEFPEMMIPGGNFHCSYSVISILRGGNDDEGSFMLLYMLGKFICYKFMDKGYKIIYEFDQGYASSGHNSHLLMAYPYIECISSIKCFQELSNSGDKRRGQPKVS